MAGSVDGGVGNRYDRSGFIAHAAVVGAAGSQGGGLVRAIQPIYEQAGNKVHDCVLKSKD